MSERPLATVSAWPRYAVVGVWRDGNPVELSRHNSYDIAAATADELAHERIPFVGVIDLDNPERGYDPWASLAEGDDRLSQPAASPSANELREPDYPWWCGRFSVVIQHLLDCRTLGEADIDRRLAQEALDEYTAELAAWDARERA